MTEGSATTSIDGPTGPRLMVIGLGGAGGNAVDNMIRAKLDGVDFLVANTDAQALEQSQCERRVQLGRGVTRGLGAGSRPDVGRAAAEEALDEVLGALEGAHMLFITAGMGGGTGTGGAPVIAQAAREAGVLTVGVVTKPFHFEGIRRMRVAEAGIIELGKQVDTLIVIPNQNLFRVVDEKTTFADAFRIADEVLHSGVRGVTDLMVMPGLINLDFADIQSVMAEMGKAIMGTGEAEGENRALEAAEAAISNPLLDDVSMKGARGVLVNIAGGMDLTLFEVDQAANRIRDEVDSEANIIFGSVFDQRLEGRMRVSVVATGIEAEAQGGQAARSVPLSLIVSRSRDEAAAEEPAAPAVAPDPVSATEPSPEPEAEAEAELEPAPEPEPKPVPISSAGSTKDEADGAAAASGSATSREKAGETGMEPTAQGGGTAFKAIRDDIAEWPTQAATAPAGDSTVVEIATPAMPHATSKPLFEPAPKSAPTSAVKSATAPAKAASPPNLAPDSGPDTESAADSEPEPKKRRSGGLFSWMAARSGAGSEENFEKGDRHYYGQGVRKNLGLALRAYRKAAEQGHAAAQNRLGWMYEKGEGTEADYAEAVTWYQRAAEQGHINAMNDLGYMHRQGWGVPQSYSEALRWFRDAAEKYDSYAEYNMGQMYENGWGVEKDLDEAIRWFRRSAARGHEWAAKRLEEMGVRT
jgi:cell division protein FtsZ